jgi:hypothetical protein
MGSAVERRAPGSILESATGGCPEKAWPLYPFPEKAGIEVFGSDRSNGLVYYMSYKFLEKVVVEETTVRVSFHKSQGPLAITELMMVTASEYLAARLAASISRKTSRRLLLNKCVTGMIMVLANGIKLRLGSCMESADKPTAE